MGVIEVMELIGEGVMYTTCVCLHIKPLKLSPEMACRPMFYPFIPFETHTGSNGKVQWATSPYYHVDVLSHRLYQP